MGIEDYLSSFRMSVAVYQFKIRCEDRNVIAYLSPEEVVQTNYHLPLAKVRQVRPSRSADLNCAKRDVESRALLGEQNPSSLPSKHAKIRKSVWSAAEARPSASRCLSEKFPTDLADSSLDYHPSPSSSSAFKNLQ